MEKIFNSHSPEETEDFGKNLASELHPGLLTLQADLGGGKTKLASGILQGLGAEGPYQSPTFMLMKEYHLPQGIDTAPPKAGKIARVYHVDAYRLTAKDFQELGFQEWLDDKQALTILEWPENIQELLPQKRVAITLVQKSETEREIQIIEER